jgi:hypothetical protein
MDPTAAEITRVRQSAATAFGALPGSQAEFHVGNPQRVGSPDGSLTYWLVPGLLGEQILGMTRILPDGRVATVGLLKAPAMDCAQAVTGLSTDEAVKLTNDLDRQYPGSQVSEPMLVHDGPVGREAWLYTVKPATGSALWIFATAGGLYSRPAGTSLASNRS